ncbi:DUF4159 domain-containing protein [Zunongwangia endophytica]|uniref:DUF4159 domain-containing protein n=1 Tax=Zunongwangia endophytica TaxID=1808945 RepID=A0ABV8HCK6_9FLAO|nr:DUF4159 domain-containing protein [Zunongwangia endophytica]MDN3593987.1 DUF4159 domain-containing protein [Zunongwangia endophytica]
MNKKWLFLFCLSFGLQFGNAQKVALLKYNGGGDWYANPTALPNLIQFCNQNIATKLDAKPVTITASGPELFMYPFVHMTGHGNVVFTENEAENLRNYLLGGGFLHIDDNYGMKQYLTVALKTIFPEKELIELPSSHPIFHSKFEFPKGLPKIHEHDGKRPQAFGIFDNDRLVLLFTFESDLGDGWENEEVHHDPEEVRLKALKMGANIVKYAFEN